MFFDAIFGIFPFIFGAVFLIVVASWIFNGYAITKNWRRTREAGYDPITLPADIAVATMNSELLRPRDGAAPRSTAARLAELDALQRAGTITLEERDAARARILSEV